MHLKLSPCLLSIYMACLLGSSYPAIAADQNPASTTENAMTESASYPGWEHSLMRQIAEDTNQMLVQHLQTARADLNDGKIDNARITLEAAQHLATGIREMMPFTAIVDQVGDVENDLRTSEAAILVGDLVPLYKSLEQMELYAPTLAKLSRDKLKQVETSSAQNDKDAAIKALEELGSSVASTSVYMPVRYVSTQIDAALKAMQAGRVNAEAAGAEIDKALEKL